MLVFTMKVKVINMGSPIIHQIIGQRAYVRKFLLWPFKNKPIWPHWLWHNVIANPLTIETFYHLHRKKES